MGNVEQPAMLRAFCITACRALPGIVRTPGPSVFVTRSALSVQAFIAPARFSTSRGKRQSRGMLFTELKRCRGAKGRQQLARIEKQLQPLQDAKEWLIIITARANLGDMPGASAALEEMCAAGLEPNVICYSRLIT